MTTIVYVGNSDSQDISVFRLASDGSVTLVETTPVPGPTTPGGSLPLAISPDRTRLYAGLRNEPYSAVSFAIDQATGKLSVIGSGPLADTMAYISVDRTGKFLLSASYGGSKVAVNPIGADGIVAPPQQVLPTEPKAHSILADPTNRYALVASLGGDVVLQYRFDAATGTLTPNHPPARPIEPKGGPRHFVFSPDARFVYLLNELDGTVHVLPWDPATGTLGAEAQSITALPAGFDGKPWGADIHITPDGKFLYASERTGSTLAGYGVDTATGRLTAIGSTLTETQPRAFAIDPSSRYLLAVGQLSDSMTTYAIGPTGELTRLAATPVGRNPNWVEIIDLP